MPRLVNIKLDLKLPRFGGIQATWKPDETEVRAAWELYMEMVTRTPLGEFLPADGQRLMSVTRYEFGLNHIGIQCLGCIKA